MILTLTSCGNKEEKADNTTVVEAVIHEEVSLDSVVTYFQGKGYEFDVLDVREEIPCIGKTELLALGDAFNLKVLYHGQALNFEEAYLDSKKVGLSVYLEDSLYADINPMVNADGVPGMFYFGIDFSQSFLGLQCEEEK